MPFLRIELDDGGSPARVRRRLLQCRPKRRYRPSAQRRQEQQRAHQVGDKPRKYQKNSAQHGGETGTFQVDRPQSRRCDSAVAQTGEVLAPGPPQQPYADQPRWRETR